MSLPPLPPEFFETCQLSDESLNHFIDVHQLPAVRSVRVNPAKYTPDFEKYEKVPWCAHGVYMAEGTRFVSDPNWHAGTYYVQEASSMFIDQVFKQYTNIDRQYIALDLCASPGGKSTLMASALSPESLIIANEVIGSRISPLKENLIKWGLPNLWLSNSDAIKFGQLGPVMDIVLIDAPCSGSGLFRKIPEYRNSWTKDMVMNCRRRQERIVRDVLGCLNQNALLIYSTCSFSDDENEGMVDFILENTNMQSLPLNYDPAWGVLETCSKSMNGYGYRMYPHRVKGEGFFMACFVQGDIGKIGGAIQERSTSVKPFPLDISSWLDSAKAWSWYLQQDDLFMLPVQHQHTLHQLNSVKWIKRGTCMGRMVRGQLIPDHELAMSINLNHSLPCLDLTLEQSLTYLRKEVPQELTFLDGWQLVKYQGSILGWLKGVGHRANNYYPSAYRILKNDLFNVSTDL